MEDVLIRDKEAELSGLKLECINEALTLTNILISIDSAREELIDIETKRKEFDEYVIQTKTFLKAEDVQITSGKTYLIKLKETSSKELSQLKEEVRVANKELSLANSRVLSARDEIVEIDKKRDVILLKVSELNLLVEMLPKIKFEISELEEKRNELRKDISEMIDSSILELTQARGELVKITKSVEKKIEEVNQAEYTTKKYVDELYTHMNDYEIIKGRLESVYRTKFPELDLKI